MNGMAYVFIGSEFSYISFAFDLCLIYTTIRSVKGAMRCLLKTIS